VTARARRISKQRNSATESLVGVPRESLLAIRTLGRSHRLGAASRPQLVPCMCGSEIFTFACRKRLTTLGAGLKYRTIPKCPSLSDGTGMNNIQPSTTTPSYRQSEAMDQKCLHPRVQVVSRDEDAEFVECLECREIFESSEFRDMDIEAKIPTEEE
jgi:hypothetical protein